MRDEWRTAVSRCDATDLEKCMYAARRTHLNVPSFLELCHDRAIPV